MKRNTGLPLDMSGPSLPLVFYSEVEWQFNQGMTEPDGCTLGADRYAQLASTDVMPVANFRFYAELNDFLARERRFTEFAYSFLDVATVKDRIESFGVPHTEVD